MPTQSKISIFALVMLMTGAVDSISNLPSIAIFGPQLITFFILAMFLFLIPTGMIAAELCAQFKDRSGVYVWGKTAYGSHFGALIIWLQWINTMVWFPTCLTTFVGTAAYLINPELSHHPLYLVVTSLSAFWIVTLLNLNGIKESTRMAAFATTLGMAIPMFLIIGLSYTWALLGKPLALHISTTNAVPNFNNVHSWTSLTAIITSFLGIELATVHARKIKNADKLFPRAFVYSILVIVLTMGLGSLGVALVIPHEEIVLVTGTIQAFSKIFQGFQLPWLEKVLGFMLLFGSLGTMINWLISPANGLAHAAEDGYLPRSWANENQHGVPYKIFLLQGLVVSAVSMVFFLMPSVNGSYWFLLDLSTELYVIMYTLMFIAAAKLVYQAKNIILIPGGKTGAFTVTTIGLVGCVLTLLVGFVSPANIDVGGSLNYILIFGSGIIFMVFPAGLLIWYKRKFGMVAAQNQATTIVE